MKQFYLLILIGLLFSCTQQEKTLQSPASPSSDLYDLDEIQGSGEMIVLTLSGPDTYYDYRGKTMGYQFEISEMYGSAIGARIRIELAKNESDLIDKLMKGDGDLIAYSLPDSLLALHPDLVSKGDSLSHWSIRKKSVQLAENLENWFTASADKRLAYKQQENDRETNNKRQSKISPRAPIKNLAAGIISDYDALFKRYASNVHWDWRLIAAQAYQESAFDPQATSWAGAQGLMQLMPGTAREMNVSNPYNAEENVRGAIQYLQIMNRQFGDIDNQEERIKFMLAAYNCGTMHVKDAQALAVKYGHDSRIWTGHVDQYVKALSDPKYYRDPVVKYGYCRGNEPYMYVIQIMDRFQQYRSQIR